MRYEPITSCFLAMSLLIAAACGPPAHATLELSGAVERTVKLESEVGIQHSTNGPELFTMYQGEGARVIVTVPGHPFCGEVELVVDSIEENLRDGAGATAFVHRMGWRGEERAPFEIEGYFGGSIETVAGTIELGGEFYMRAQDVAPGSAASAGDSQRFTNAQGPVSIHDTTAEQNNSTVPEAFTAPWFTEGDDLMVTGTFDGAKVTFDGGEAISCVGVSNQGVPSFVCGAERTMEHRGCTYHVTIVVEPNSTLRVMGGQDPACEKERVSYNAQLGVAE